MIASQLRDGFGSVVRDSVDVAVTDWTMPHDRGANRSSPP
jgi:hypothetical protein